MVPAEADSTVRLTWVHSVAGGTDYYELQSYVYPDEEWVALTTQDDDSTGVTFDIARGVYNYRIRAINTDADPPDTATAWTEITTLYKHQADMILGKVHAKNANGIIASTPEDTAYYYAYPAPVPLAITDLTGSPWERFDPIVVDGTNFGAVKGSVEIGDGTNFLVANVAAQVENPWTDTQITIPSMTYHSSWIDKDNLYLRVITAEPETVMSTARLFSTTAPDTATFTAVAFDTTDTDDVQLGFAATLNEEGLAWWRWKAAYDGSYSPAMRWYSSEDHADTTRNVSISDTLNTGLTTAELDSAWVMVSLKDKAQNIRELGPFLYDFTREVPAPTCPWAGEYVKVSNDATLPDDGGFDTVIDLAGLYGGFDYATPGDSDHATLWNSSGLYFQHRGRSLPLNTDGDQRGSFVWFGDIADSLSGGTVTHAVLGLCTDGLVLTSADTLYAVFLQTDALDGWIDDGTDLNTTANHIDLNSTTLWDPTLASYSAIRDFGIACAVTDTSPGGL